VRYLILSDLHANWQALETVLQDAAGGYGQILCLGDLVGYGGDPNAVVDWARANCALVVRGNHDKASTGVDREELEWFNPVAREAALWTYQSLTPENAAYVSGLPKGPLAAGGFRLVHGSPFDEDEYVLSPDEAGQAFGYLESRVTFFGHTHVQGGFIWNHSRVEIIPRTPLHSDRQAMEIDPACAYLINPGSVGQPRDGDPRAAYLTFDSEAGMVTFFRVAYDVTRAQDRIREAGLPPILADRLSVGR
jgi:diadenosine tetraphosphatase ApaH/serine/threonine PP2A family protein phosphatase